MIIIPVQQPWASAAVLGAIDVLNVPWPMKRQGVRPGVCIAIMATTQDRSETARRAIGHLTSAWGVDLAGVTSALIGTVEVERNERPDDCQLLWAFGPHCWVIRNPRLLAQPLERTDPRVNGDVLDVSNLETLTPRQWRRRESEMNQATELQRRNAMRSAWTGD